MFEVRTVRYGINDEQRAIDDARREAVKSARRQAEVYADAAGVNVRRCAPEMRSQVQHARAGVDRAR